jgi:hypothetical protein
MPQHGDIDKDTKKMYCGYWMTIEEWQDIHSYWVNEKIDASDID